MFGLVFFKVKTAAFSAMNTCLYVDLVTVETSGFGGDLEWMTEEGNKNRFLHQQEKRGRDLIGGEFF